MLLLLKHRNACLYLVGQTFSLFGDTALWLAMGIWVKVLTGSNTAAGLVFFTLALPSLSAPLLGYLVDRVHRRPLLIATNLITGGMVLLLLFVQSRYDIWLIYVVMFFYGISSSLIGSAQSAFLTTLLPAERLGEANGFLQTAHQGLRLIGPLIGAGLFAWLGGGAVAIIDAFTFIIAAGMLCLIHIEEPMAECSQQHWVAEMLAGLKHIKEVRVLYQLAIACAISMLVIGFGETILFAVVDEGLHRPPTFLAILLTIQGIGGLLGGLTTVPVMRRLTEGLLTAIGIACIALGTGFILSTSLPLVLVGMICFGFGLPWLVVGSTTLLQRATPPQLQGRVYSAFDVLTGTPQIISIALGAMLVTFVNYHWLLLIMALVLVCATIYLCTRREQWQHRPISSEMVLSDNTLIDVH